MKIIISVALEENDAKDFALTLLDGTVLNPDAGVVVVDPAPFLKDAQK